MITTYLVALSLLITIHAYSAPAVDGAHFLETFQDASWADRWIITENKEFEGEWIVRENDEPIGIEGDKGLVAANEAKKHGIAVEFDSALDTTGETLVVQYEVRTQKSLSCGGAYIKLLRKETMPSELSAFDNTTPYTIMFGPDKCGADSKVHFIFNHKNPKTGEYEEKHMTDRPQMKANTLSHLYTLVVNSDNTFQVLIDTEEVRSGSLLEDFEPSVNPPKEIDDPTDKKPDTWVDEAQIPDPEAVKPDDWDEDAPAEIEDKDAVKPDDWLDDGELEIPDPDASKPEDWDDELDGDWDAPLVPNPQCAKVGCGEWKPPTIPNPEYKGKWSAPMIENPDYIGEWKPKQIPNPNYFEDGQPSNFEAIGGIGIEIWTMSKDILFDNVLVTSDKDAADAFAKKTWLVRHYEEDRKYIDMNKPPSPSLQAQFEEILANTLVFIQENPAIIAATALIGLVPIALCFMGGSKPKRGEDVPEEEDEDEDEEPLLPKKEEKKVKKTRSRTRRDVD